jgi:predicted dehydrogenase
MIPFAVIGAGWRTEFFLRIARACPQQFRAVGVLARDLDKAAYVERDFGVALFDDLELMLQEAKPLFVVTSVSWGANPDFIKRLAALKVPVLSETPPATSVDEMLELWSLAEAGAKIQVAEQYHLQPQHAARLAFAASGKMGTVTQAQVAIAHGYHGISLMRRFLGVDCQSARISAYGFSAPMMQGPGRDGWPETEKMTDSGQVVAHFDFDGKLGVFDFCNDQYFSPIRGNRLLVRGERGEIIDDTAVYLRDFRTPIQVGFRREAAGVNGNLEGHFLKGIQAGEEWVYHNPLAPGALADDEIAIGHCLLKMAAYVEGGPPLYALAEACQDRYLDILMHQAAESGQMVESQQMPWSAGLGL